MAAAVEGVGDQEKGVEGEPLGLPALPGKEAEKESAFALTAERRTRANARPRPPAARLCCQTESNVRSSISVNFASMKTQPVAKTHEFER